MDVVSWKPVITFTKSRPGSQNPMYRLDVDLRCGFCGETTTKDTFRHELTLRQHIRHGQIMVSQVSHMTVNALGKLKTQHACELCGMVSIIPPKQFTQLLEQVQQLITETWIRDQIEAHPVKDPKDIQMHQVRPPRLA